MNWHSPIIKESSVEYGGIVRISTADLDVAARERVFQEIEHCVVLVKRERERGGWAQRKK